MPKDLFQRKVFTVAAVLLGALGLLHKFSRAEQAPWHKPLSAFPLEIEGWYGENLSLDLRQVSLLGVDDYLYRRYRDASGQVVELYIGYYATQRNGDTMHSPKNCLPGSGWEPVHSKVLSIIVPTSEAFIVNEYLVEKGLDRRLVLYWYQGRGRVVASEYAGKIWLMLDSIRLNRTDGGVVRLVTSTREGESRALDRAVTFARDLYPRLNGYIPN
jgi:EpsI family protein